MVIMSSGRRDSCLELFIQVNILLLTLFTYLLTYSMVQSPS